MEALHGAEMEALFARSLAGDYEGEPAWAAVRELRNSGSREVFDYAAAWCGADDPLKRARAVAVICQLRSEALSAEPLYRDESYALISRMLECERDPLVLDSAVSALGHLRDARAVPLIVRYRDHAEGSVRFAVAFALGCFPNDSRSIECLIELASDSDSEVRDWAVFGLGVQGEADSAEIREALVRCLDDEDRNVREEAAVGLGKRRDDRVVPALRRMLEEPEVSVRVCEAAAAYLGLEAECEDWAVEDYADAVGRLEKSKAQA
jgi:HEAT repeat protein